MEPLAGLIPSSLLLRPMPLKSNHTVQALNVEKLRMIVDVGKLHEALDNVHEDVAIRNEQAHTRA